MRGVGFEAHRRHRARLLVAQQFAGAADLQIVGGHLEAGAQLGEPLQHRQPLLGLGSHARLRRHHQIAEGALARAADAAAQLVELGQAEAVRAVHDHGVGARDVQADSMMVVHTSMSIRPSTKSTITFSSSPSPIWPWPTPMRVSAGASSAHLLHPFVQSPRCGCARRRPVRRAPAP